MNTINMPGFTAEASLSGPSEQYHTPRGSAAHTAGGVVLPQFSWCLPATSIQEFSDVVIAIHGVRTVCVGMSEGRRSSRLTTGNKVTASSLSMSIRSRIVVSLPARSL